MKKDIIELVKKINDETKKEGEKIAEIVNNDKELNTWFSKWSYGCGLFEKRGKEVMEIQKELRDKGHDIKMNMQSYELYYYGDIKE